MHSTLHGRPSGGAGQRACHIRRARQGRGHPAYAEIKYRLEPFRTPSVMDDFMARLDEAIKRHAGLTARIRCFGYPADTIYARN